MILYIIMDQLHYFQWILLFIYLLGRYLIKACDPHTRLQAGCCRPDNPLNIAHAAELQPSSPAGLRRRISAIT